jgi:3-oxoacyl-[acyl-carrier protein] reductase
VGTGRADRFVETDDRRDKQPATISEWCRRHLGTPAEVAAAVVFPASGEAANDTRRTLPINGGMAMI